MTTLFAVFNNSGTSLRRNCCRFGGVFVAGCTGNRHSDNSIAVGCGNCIEMAILSGFFFVFGNNLWAFDELSYWFLNCQPSFYYSTAIPLSILFHSILFQCTSFQILFLWILFLMWAIYVYIYISLSLSFFNVLLHVCFMYHYLVPLFICIYIYICIFIY